MLLLGGVQRDSMCCNVHGSDVFWVVAGRLMALMVPLKKIYIYLTSEEEESRLRLFGLCAFLFLSVPRRVGTWQRRLFSSVVDDACMHCSCRCWASENKPLCSLTLSLSAASCMLCGPTQS